MPGLSGALDIARWSMYSSQLAIEVTANNVANANTLGYSRQTLEMVAGNSIKSVNFVVCSTNVISTVSNPPCRCFAIMNSATPLSFRPFSSSMMP